jgi:hypothetical protein
MSLTFRETLTLIHGMFFGGGFLLTFTGGLALLYHLQTDLLTAAGTRRQLFWLKLATLVMAGLAWAAVLFGTYIIYPWYYTGPRSFLIGESSTALWDAFGMAWKQHIAWFAPLLTTAVAFVVWRYGAHLAADSRLRWSLIVLFALAFAAASIAGLMGALVTKTAPVS